MDQATTAYQETTTELEEIAYQTTRVYQEAATEQATTEYQETVTSKPTTAFTTTTDLFIEENIHCKNISDELIPNCGEGQKLELDPFGRPHCTSLPFHFPLMTDIFSNNNEIEDNENTITADKTNHHPKIQTNMAEILSRFPTRCFVPGTSGK